MFGDILGSKLNGLMGASFVHVSDSNFEYLLIWTFLVIFITKIKRVYLNRCTVFSFSKPVGGSITFSTPMYDREKKASAALEHSIQ